MLLCARFLVDLHVISVHTQDPRVCIVNSIKGFSKTVFRTE